MAMSRHIIHAHRPVYDIVVGNIGRVYETTIEADARDRYDQYVRLSIGQWGRAAGEMVALYCDGEVVEEHMPSPGQTLDYSLAKQDS